MIVDGHHSAHLTYCTNVHPGESGDAILKILVEAVPSVKRRVAPNEAFGVGLRLAATAVRELQAPERLAELKETLHREGLYVFTLNGFPYGTFHGAPIKESVYRPDWCEPERLEYTKELARLLAELLTGTELTYGSISTVPIGFSRRVTTTAMMDEAVGNLLKAASFLREIEATTGIQIQLALEPEPWCVLETTLDAVRFFKERLFGDSGRRRFAEMSGASLRDSESLIARYIGVCLDACHSAVQFEEPEMAVDSLVDAGITIAKCQVSSALRVRRPNAAMLQTLREFDDAEYLHQVVIRSERGDSKYLELSEALRQNPASEGSGERDEEWRVHFHVPIYRDELMPFMSTQSTLRDLMLRQRLRPFTTHLEVETYTWGVLPEAHRETELSVGIARELQWVRGMLGL